MASREPGTRTPEPEPEADAATPPGDRPRRADRLIDLSILEQPEPGTHLRDRLFDQAELFDDPSAYRAGVNDTIQALQELRLANVETDPARVAAYALGLAYCEQERLTQVLAILRVVDGDVGVLREATGRLRELEHRDGGAHQRALDLLADAIAATEPRSG